MPYIIKCEEMKTPSFHNGDSEEWNKQVTKVSEWVEKYMGSKSSGMKDLMYSLLSHGYCTSANYGRLSLIRDILVKKGYHVNVSS